MNIVKKLLKTIMVLIVALLCLIITWAVWEHVRDPLAAIDLVSKEISLQKDSVFTAPIITEERIYHEVTLQSTKTGLTSAIISRPLIPADSSLPVVVILGGLGIGARNFSFIENPGNNILVIYYYPYSPEYWYESTALREVPKIRNAVIKVPAQVVELVSWLKQQSWCDDQRLSILGYSFGAMFVPAVYHLLTAKGIKTGPGIIAYGGTDIRTMLYTNLRMGRPSRFLTAWFAATAIRVVEPALHLPYMQNEFLLINGNRDKQIPRECWQKLHELTPQPREIIILNEGHMHPQKPELTLKLVNISRTWLLKKKMLNPLQ